MVKDLDAVYVNFISGFELCLGTAQALRQGFRRPIYADLHSLFLGMQQDGIRVLRRLPDAPSWFGCFDFVQLNEDEMHQLTADPLILAAEAMGVGVSLLTVTLGPRGAAYVAAPGFDGLTGGQSGRRSDSQTIDGFGLEAEDLGPTDRLTVRPADLPTVRTALVPAPQVEALDPTGCGDVFGAALFARLLAGDSVEPALRHATKLAARNAAFRGASGLSRYLRGELVLL